MPRDVEQALRGSLQARAQDVRPDPATWERVADGIRRRQRGRWALAGAAAVAVVVLAVLVTPALMGSRVDLTPVPPADQPDLGNPVGAGGALVTDGASLRVVGPGGETVSLLRPPTEADEPLPFHRVTVRPGSTADDLTAMYVRADANCERVEIGWLRAGEDDGDGSDPRRGGPLGGGQGLCITDPVWSPDGGHVAWVERHPDGQFWLRVLAWDADAPAGEAASSIKLETEALDDLQLTDWVVAGSEEEAALYLTGVDRTSAQSLRLGLEHQDGAVEPTGALSPAGWEGENAEVTEVLVKALDGADRPAVRLLAHPDGTARLAPAPDAPGERELPPDVLDADDARSGEVWLAARDDSVLLGLRGRAWHVRRSGDELGAPVKLAGTVVHAGLLDAEPRPDPDEADEDVPPASGDDPLVTTDGQAIAHRGPDGPTVVARADEAEVTDFAVHPASSPDDLTVVWREGVDCDATLHFVHVVDGTEDAGGQLDATCPGTPVFSPDGDHLAWMSQPNLGGEPLQDEPALGLETIGWDGEPTGGLTTFELPADPAETMALDLHDWVWTDGSAVDTAGMLYLSGYDGHGTVRAYTAPIERQGDGSLALPADATARTVTSMGDDSGAQAVLRVDGHHEAPPVTYTLEKRGQGQESQLAVVRSAAGIDEEVVLPDGLLRVNTTGAEPQDEVWLTARGDTVLLGDGDARAWKLPWTDGQGELEPLDGDVRFAVRAPTGSSAEHSVQAEDSAHDDLPDAVADTREAILQAARDEDVAELAELAGAEFISSFGGPEDPEAFFVRLRDQGELDLLVRILELPYGTEETEGAGVIYAWPAVFTVAPEDWGDEEDEQLRALGSQEDIDRWREFGGYIGWRAGIHADGTWRYYVAGD